VNLSLEILYKLLFPLFFGPIFPIYFLLFNNHHVNLLKYKNLKLYKCKMSFLSLLATKSRFLIILLKYCCYFGSLV
jgi:hypothetical protein